MKRGIWLVAIMLTTVPVFAQDDRDGGFDSFESSNSDDSFGGGDSFGDFQPSIPKFDPLIDVRNLLAKAGAPLMEKKQEKSLDKLYDKEVKAATKAFKERFGLSLESALATQTPGRARGGANQRRIGAVEAAEARRISSQLVDKVIAALRMDQQASLRKYQSEQLRVARLNQITRSMAAAGSPLTVEQKPQVEALFARESRLRTLMIIEAKGEPHATKVAQLEAQTTQRVVGLLDPVQKTRLTDAISGSRARQTAPSRSFFGTRTAQ